MQNAIESCKKSSSHQNHFKIIKFYTITILLLKLVLQLLLKWVITNLCDYYILFFMAKSD